MTPKASSPKRTQDTHIQYQKWFQIREEEYQKFLAKQDKELKFDTGIKDLIHRFNSIHPQFLIYKACSGYLNDNGGLVSFLNPYIRMMNTPVGYGLSLSPTIEEIEAYQKINEIILGLEDQVNFYFDAKAIKIHAEYPDGSYEIDGDMRSEVLYNIQILQPEHGAQILKVLWTSFERLVDYFDLKGENFDFQSKKFAPPAQIVALRKKFNKVLPKEISLKVKKKAA